MDFLFIFPFFFYFFFFFSQNRTFGVDDSDWKVYEQIATNVDNAAARFVFYICIFIFLVFFLIFLF